MEQMKIHNILERKNRLFLNYEELCAKEEIALQNGDLKLLRVSFNEKNHLLNEVQSLDGELQLLVNVLKSARNREKEDFELKSLVDSAISRVKSLMKRENDIKRMAEIEKEKVENELLIIDANLKAVGKYFDTSDHKPRFVDVNR